MSASRPRPAYQLMKFDSDAANLEFKSFRSLDYRSRWLWMAGLVVAGLAAQAAFLSPWPGVPFLIGAVVLSWVVGFDAKVDRRSFHHDQAWETVPFERIAEIEKLDRKVQRWDASALDVSGCGAVVFLVVGAACVAAWALLREVVGPSVGAIVAVDAGLLLLPQWFSGMRGAFRQPDLMIKVEHVREVVRRAGPSIAKHGTLKAILLMSGKDESRVPIDLKIAVVPEDAPEGFHGVQGQVVLNRVQGKPHPYFYCVVVAKEGSDLLRVAESVPKPAGILDEWKRENGVDVSVIRQRTTRTSGYHTKPARSAEILATALEVASRFVESVR